MRSSETNNNPTTPPSADRLLAAADAILMAETSSSKGTVTMWRDDSRPARQGFSSVELIEAMMFLRRLGLVDAEQSASSRQRRAT